MRWSRWLLCVGVGVGGMVGVSVFGQTEFESVEQSPTPVVEEFDAGELVDDFAPADQPILNSDASPASVTAAPDAKVQAEERALRQKYRQLIEQKSDLMDRSALREAIGRTEKDIDELKASDKLQHTRQLLLELVDAHPETSAARTARAMLDSVREESGSSPQPTPWSPAQLRHLPRGLGTSPFSLHEQ